MAEHLENTAFLSKEQFEGVFALLSDLAARLRISAVFLAEGTGRILAMKKASGFAGDATVLSRLLQKRGQVALDDLIQHGLSRVSSRVGGGLGAWRGSSPRAGCARHTGCSAARAPCCDVRGVA